MRRIFTRSPFYLNVKDEYVEPEVEIPAGSDGPEEPSEETPEEPTPQTPEEPTNPINEPPTLNTREFVYNCGQTDVTNGFVGNTVYNREYSDLFANFVCTYTVVGTPAKLTFEWGDEIVSTGYVGNNAYDDDLIALGIDPSEINTIPINEFSGGITITKDEVAPTLVKLTVTTPLPNSSVTTNKTCETLGGIYETTDAYIMRIVSKPSPAATFSGDVGNTGNLYINDVHMYDNLAVVRISKTQYYSKDYVFYDVNSGVFSGDIFYDYKEMFFPNVVPDANRATYCNSTFTDITDITVNGYTFVKLNHFPPNDPARYFDIRWYKGTLNTSTGEITDLCVVNDWDKNYGFITSGLFSTQHIHYVKNTCL